MSFFVSRYRFRWVACLAVLLAGVAQAEPTPIPHRVLPENLLIHPTPYFENTAKVVTPGRSCPRGAIVVVTGQPRDKVRILSRPLRDEAGRLDRLSPTLEMTYPTGPEQAIATDNQIVRLKDGSLLCAKDSYLWGETPSRHSVTWQEEMVTGSGNHPGQRGGVILWRSTDGGKKWSVRSVIDFAEAAGGKYGYPRPMSDAGAADVPVEQQGSFPDGKKKWWVGGCDRTEVYACPFTGRVYLTTRVISGPYRDAPQHNTLLLFGSRDGGRTWEAIKEDFPAWSPMVMTSAPDGRLFLLQIIGDQPTLYFTRAAVRARSRAWPEISPGYPIYDTEQGKAVPSLGGESVDLFFQVAHPSLSRASRHKRSSAVRVAYQTKNADGMQEARIARAEVKDPGQAPEVTPIACVRAEDSRNYSVMYFTFIDPDFAGMPVRAASDASVLYWIEAPRKGLPERRYAARYLVLEGDTATPPAHLSIAEGRPRTWEARQDIGDYMTGGFFWDPKERTLNYLAQWVEPQGIVANIVTVPAGRFPEGGRIENPRNP